MRGPGKLLASECPLVEVKIDGGIREGLARGFSSAGMELQPKRAQVCTSLGRTRLLLGCKVSGPVELQQLFRFYSEHQAAPPRLHLIKGRNVWPKRSTDREKGRRLCRGHSVPWALSRCCGKNSIPQNNLKWPQNPFSTTQTSIKEGVFHLCLTQV